MRGKKEAGKRMLEGNETKEGGKREEDKSQST